ncbi:hypothetical protein [Vibrio hepatarius]|uniref:hypothetical protein n=1 Tax=Vibrio hepatarius TaxID=171383 RepID=UPI001C094477|nr:hypothetical protein [Vibrio hepatarius]MBU2896762.1 hypothetical protein [Vibrio hepatarius]
MKKVLAYSFSILWLYSSLSHSMTYVYCGLSDGSDWEWLLDQSGNYETIDGTWGQVHQGNGRYFNVFRVTESQFDSKAFNCPAGYTPQPADRGTSRWEVFEIQKPDGTQMLIDSYKTYYNTGGAIPSTFRL